MCVGVTAEAFQMASAPSSKLVRQDRSGPLVDQMQRSMVKLFAKGDRVQIFSSALQEWMLDGEVVEVIKERCVRDGIQVRAGSTKVVYGRGRRYKWVPPCALEDAVRALPLARLPEPVAGELFLATQSWLQKTMHFELDRGFLQWWHTEEDAKSEAPPAGWLHLPGSRHVVQGASILLWAHAGRGAAYDLKAATSEEASRWADALGAHAAFCREEAMSVNSSVPCDVVI